MKTKTILFAFCLFCCAPLANAQTNVYHPFPDSNAVWRVDVLHYPYNEYTERYYLTGDTLINAKAYKKIYMDSAYLLNILDTENKNAYIHRIVKSK